MGVTGTQDYATRAGDVGRGTIAVLFALLLAAVSIPVLTHPQPPLVDYINNLAGAYAIATVGADADLQRYYTVDWQIIPNLMMNLIVPALHRFVNIYVAGQIFTLACIALILSGTFALNRALFGRWTVAPLAAGVLIYNEVLLVGVMNYIFGIGLALWALAAWVALRARSWPLRLAVSAAFVALLFFCHLFAVGLYGIGVLAFELNRLWAQRGLPWWPRLADFVASGAPFLVAIALLLAGPTVGLAGEVHWQLDGKLDGILLAFTVYFYSVAYVVIGVMVLAIAVAAWLRLLRIHPVGWTILAVSAVVYLAMPRVLFATHLADQRLPVALAFMLIACLDLDLRRRPVKYAAALLLAGLLALRLGEVQTAWNGLADDIAAFRRSAMTLPRGARVLVVHADRAAFEEGTVSVFGLLHAAAYAIIERSALVSTAFVVPGKHVLQPRAPFHRIFNVDDFVPPRAEWLAAAATPADAGKLYWSDWPRNFDYVYVLFTRPGAANPDVRHLEPAGDGPGFQRYRVMRTL